MRALIRAALFSGLVIVLGVSGPALAQPPPEVRPAPVHTLAPELYCAELTAVAFKQQSTVAVSTVTTVPAPAQPAAPTSSIQGVGQIDGPKFRGPPRLVGRKRKVHGRWYKFYHIKGQRRADLPIDPGRPSAG